MWIDDAVLAECHEALTIRIWVPDRVMVVLGSSNQAERECYASRCQEDGVAVLKRYGGGGCVVLHPGCVVVSVGAWVEHPYRNDHYFRLLNQSLIRGLAASWPLLGDLTQRGISDLAWGERKIAGTSLFRSRNYLLYQASLLVDSGIALIERYLPHPSREPGYRQNKGHRDFVGALAELLPGLTPETVADRLRTHLVPSLTMTLGGELIAAQEKQVPHLRRKLAEATKLK